METVAPLPGITPRQATRGAFLIGFAASGFFDGILLHQILQWHHLLSSLTVGILGSLRGQVLFDGLFHAAMYVVLVIGLITLYRTGVRRIDPSSYPRMHAYFWMGFGVWHFVDAVVSHWITGIHRVRMDVPNPLVWDLAWLFAFGVIPLLVARIMLKRSNLPTAGSTHSKNPFLFWIAITLTAGLWNAFPPASLTPDTVTVVLRPDKNAMDLMQAMEESDATILWSDPAGAIWVLKADSKQINTMDFYRNGAAFVSTSLGGAACGTWFDARNKRLRA